MDPQTAIDLGREAIWITLLIGAPVLVAGLLVGLVIGLVLGVGIGFSLYARAGAWD